MQVDLTPTNAHPEYSQSTASITFHIAAADHHTITTTFLTKLTATTTMPAPRSLTLLVLWAAFCASSVAAVSGSSLLQDLSDSILGNKKRQKQRKEQADATAAADGAANGNDAGSGECQLALRVLAYDKDIEAGETPHSAGYSTFRYAIYDPDGVATDEPPVGVYIGASTTVGKTDETGDCIGTGSFNFDYDADTDSYLSQVFLAVSCSGTFNAITGGTGRYSYIKNGHEVISDSYDIEGGSVSELHFSGNTCGSSAASNSATDNQ